MKIETILENSSLELEEDYAKKAKALTETNPSLPFRVKSNKIFFNEYIIGELRIDDLCINIKPRNDAFTLKDYFQILQFLDRPLLEDIDGFGFEMGGELFNLSDISNQFCLSCSQLLQFGLTGNYINEFTFASKVTGDIIFNEFRSQLIPYSGIPLEISSLELDVPVNQVIRGAIVKLIEAEGEIQNSIKYQLLRDFDQVSDIVFTEDEVDDVIESFYSPNPFYLPTLELARRILFRLELEYKDGEIEWLAFLESSNLIFENYVRTILEVQLKEKITKWEKPVSFARMNWERERGEKSFSPDILISYNKLKSSAAIVLDVKNKSFEPEVGKSINDLVSSSDLYQIMFYCAQLKTNLGGLIYPSKTTNKPLRITFDIDSDLEIYLFSVNMGQNMADRHKKLAQDIQQFLLSKC